MYEANSTVKSVAYFILTHGCQRSQTGHLPWDLALQEHILICHSYPQFLSSHFAQPILTIYRLCEPIFLLKNVKHCEEAVGGKIL